MHPNPRGVACNLLLLEDRTTITERMLTCGLFFRSFFRCSIVQSHSIHAVRLIGEDFRTVAAFAKSGPEFSAPFALCMFACVFGYFFLCSNMQRSRMQNTYGVCVCWTTKTTRSKYFGIWDEPLNFRHRRYRRRGPWRHWNGWMTSVASFPVRGCETVLPMGVLQRPRP